MVMFLLFDNMNFLFFKYVAMQFLFLPAMTMTIGQATPQSNWFADNLVPIITAVVTIVGAIIASCGAVIAAIIRNRGEEKPKSGGARANRSYRRHAKQYRQSIQNIAQVQVLGFSQPFNIEEIYVQPRVYKNDVFQYTNEDAQLELAQQSQGDVSSLQHQREAEGPKEWEPEMAIQEFRRCVMVGEPGAGKTTLLKHLTLRSARRELVDLHLPDIPLYIELSTAVTDESKDLLGLLVSQWEQYAHVPADIARVDLEQAIRNGKVLLLLDGLDETAVGSDSDQARKTYSHVLQLIQAFVKTHDKLYVVVTARKATYYNSYWPRLQGFTELEIAKLTPYAITHFMGKYFNASDPSSSKQMVRSLTTVLKRNKPIERLAANPLLLLLIVLVYRKDRALPAKKAELYDRCVEWLLRSWDAPKYIPPANRVRAFPPPSKNEDKLLAVIAWHLHGGGRRYFPRQKMLEIIAEFLLTLNPTISIASEKNAEVLDLMVSTHSLIVEQSPGIYGFSHMTFQEYFVALYIRDNSLIKTLIENIHKPWWEEVILLYANLASDTSPLLRELLDRSKLNDPAEKLFHVSLLLAGRCLESATFLNGVLRTKILKRLCAILRTTPYVYLQCEISDIVMRAGDIERLLDLLKRPGIEACLAKNITAAMGYSIDNRLPSVLFGLLQNKEGIDPYIRAHISLAIGKIGARMDVKEALYVRERLLNLLTDSSKGEWYVRLRITDALGEFGDPTIAPELVRMFLQPDDNDSIYYRLAITLGKLGNSAIIPDLFDLLRRKDNHLDDYVQGGIIVALRMMVNQQVIRFFVQTLQKKDMSSYMRCQIARAFKDIERADVPIEDLLNILDDLDIDSEVSGELAATCCKLRAYSAIPILLQHLSCKVPNRDIDIAGTLSSLNYRPDATVLSPLYELLKEPALAPDRRGNILAILGIIGIDDRAQDIIQFVYEESFQRVCPKVQINVIQALGYLGKRNSLWEQEIIKLLLKMIGQKGLNVYVGRSITETLNMLKMQNYASDLLNLLSNSNPIDSYIRQGIVQIISHCELNDIDRQTLLQLLPVTDIPNDVFEALMNCFHLRVS